MIFIPRNLLITAAFLLACVFAMGFYVLHLKRQSEEAAARIQIQSLAPHATGPQEKVPVFIAYDDEGVIREESDSVPEVKEPSERAREVLRALLARYLEKPSPHPLGPLAAAPWVMSLTGRLGKSCANAGVATIPISASKNLLNVGIFNSRLCTG